MNEFLARLGVKLVFTVVGVGLFLGYHTITGFFGGSNSQELDALPQVVFDGGGGVMELEINLNQPGQLSASFSRETEDLDEEGLYSSQELSPGTHQFRVDVAEQTYGYFEASLPDPEVGAELSWRIKMNGRVLASENEQLTEPLKDGYAFFVQFEFDDVDELKQWLARN